MKDVIRTIDAKIGPVTISMTGPLPILETILKFIRNLTRHHYNSVEDMH